MSEILHKKKEASFARKMRKYEQRNRRYYGSKRIDGLRLNADALRENRKYERTNKDMGNRIMIRAFDKNERVEVITYYDRGVVSRGFIKIIPGQFQQFRSFSIGLDTGV